MLFIHTIDKVLSSEKTQTSRLWKDDYTFSEDENDRELPNVVLSLKAWEMGKIRRLYQAGQVLSVQPNRGQKGIAKIRVLSLARRDVRNFSYDDLIAEGFGDSDSPFTWFFNVWTDMHDKTLSPAIVRNYGIVQAVKDRPKQFYDALVIKFELLDASPKPR